MVVFDYFQGVKIMNAKLFSQRFNREVATMGLPSELGEKTKAIAKVFGVTRHMANAMLFGHSLPEPGAIDRIASILEVCPLWLCGKADKRKTYSPMTVEEA